MNWTRRVKVEMVSRGHSSHAPRESTVWAVVQLSQKRVGLATSPGLGVGGASRGHTSFNRHLVKSEYNKLLTIFNVSLL